jgi:hypothetical protein
MTAEVLMKRMLILHGVVAAAFLNLTGTVVWAHHSHAMFDDSKEVTIEGSVKSFSFANPHVYLFVDVKNSDGTVTTYPVEMSYIQNMMTQGITASTFKPGDAVTIIMNPLRNGRPGGSYTGAVDAEGHKYGRSGR